MRTRQQDFIAQFVLVGLGHALLIGAIVFLTFFRPSAPPPDMSQPIELTVPDMPGNESRRHEPPAPEPDKGKDAVEEPPPQPETPRQVVDKDEVLDTRAKPEPTPKPKPDTKPKPKPDAKPETKPKTTDKKTESRKNKIEISKTIVRRPARSSGTSNTKLTPAEIQNLLNRGARTGKPTLTDAQLRSLLNSDMRFGAGVQMSEDMVYLELVRQTLYKAWDQPTELGIVGLVTRVELTLEMDGSISGFRVTSSSGNKAMDASVERAMRAVRRIPGLPADFSRSHRRIPVAFELTGGR